MTHKYLTLMKYVGNLYVSIQPTEESSSSMSSIYSTLFLKGMLIFLEEKYRR